MIFKAPRGYEGLYEVSDTGLVRGVDRISSYGRWNKSRKLKGKTLSPGVDHDGYYKVSLSKEAVIKQYFVHTLVAECFLGDKPDGYQVAHLDGNNQNNHISNLVYTTPKENAGHKKIHGTEVFGMRNGLKKHPEKAARGVDCNKSNLTESDILRIREGGEKYRVLSEELGVSITTLYNIRKYKTWKHIK